MPITVAALMTPEWIARRIQIPAGTTRVLVPGYCSGDLTPIQQSAARSGRAGTARLAGAATSFSDENHCRADYGAYDIEIIAEINHCPQLSLEEIRSQARLWRPTEPM